MFVQANFAGKASKFHASQIAVFGTIYHSLSGKHTYAGHVADLHW
jgi:hypothetical protein